MTAPDPVPSDRDLAREIDAGRAWVVRIRAGDESAFHAMFARYYEPLCRYVFALVQQDDAAEDIVQDLFVRLWEHRRDWEVHQSLRAYLYTAARARAISHLRHLRTRRKHAERTLHLLSEIAPNRPDLDFESEELRLRLEHALASLPPRTREAFRLSRVEGLSYDAVAEAMNISPKTVSVHITRSLAVLRRALISPAFLLFFRQ